MRIELYFEKIRKVIDDCPIVQLSNLTYDKRSSFEGFIRGELIFLDDSRLHFREFVDVEIEIDRLMYTYQYMGIEENLIFRYDNTSHHRKLNLSTYPHHKHEGSEKNVVTSSAPHLEEVLLEIQAYVHLL